MLRVGHGYDVHAFGGDSPLIMGGVKIDGHIGLLAHSDGDVLLHALCDALLGAAALADIGQHFPDNSADYKGVDSRVLLKRVKALLDGKGYQINNLDLTVVAQTPKMAPHIPQIRANIAADLSIAVDQVSVKATTTEKLGFVGREEGIAVYSVVLIESAVLIDSQN